MDILTFLTFYLNHLSPLQGYIFLFTRSLVFLKRTKGGASTDLAAEGPVPFCAYQKIGTNGLLASNDRTLAALRF